jgi:CTP synthase
MKKQTRFIFVTGGVMSGIGKGITTASLAKVLQSYGFRVTAIKVDPYINVDAGTMNPIEHGEVFVTADGTEGDQDLGNYERFLGEELTTHNYITTGRVYQAVIQRERNLGYQGKCVEVVPDIPNEVISRIKRVARNSQADFVLVEVGGTVGEYQNMLFLEAVRMMKLADPTKVLVILVSYLPLPATIGEMKTKPTQNAVRSLNEAGVQPEIIIGRAKTTLDGLRRKKISVFCNVSPADVFANPDSDSIYKIPLFFRKQGLGKRVLEKFSLPPRKKTDLKEWQKLVKVTEEDLPPVKIGIVGKYFDTGDFTLTDSYISVIEALKHASWFYRRQPEIDWLSAERYEKDPRSLQDLRKYDGIIIPGGFGKRGIEGKIKAIRFCREKKIPFLGLCLGMQLAVIEFARQVANFKKANSTEFSPQTPYPVIETMEEQKALLNSKDYGGTMRLGDNQCSVNPGTKSFSAYQEAGFSKTKTGHILVAERHRHRYEFNNAFRDELEKKGLVIAGENPARNLVEIIELKNHPFFVGTQFHPEFKSQLLKPHPLFREFIKVASNQK